MAAVISILGAGPHGKQLAALYPACRLYDDYLDGFNRLASAPARDEYLIGAVWPHVRRLIYDRVGFRTAYNDGRVVFPGAQIGNGARLGEHTHVLFNTVVSHGCDVGDFVTICSGAVLAGEVVVESGAFIGANAVVRHGGITIGRNATVGMGAVVCDDVPDNTKVVGNPAKPLVKP